MTAPICESRYSNPACLLDSIATDTFTPYNGQATGYCPGGDTQNAASLPTSHTSHIITARVPSTPSNHTRIQPKTYPIDATTQSTSNRAGGHHTPKSAWPGQNSHTDTPSIIIRTNQKHRKAPNPPMLLLLLFRAPQALLDAQLPHTPLNLRHAPQHRLKLLFLLLQL